MKQRVLLTLTEDNPGLTQLLGKELARCGLDAVGHMLPDLRDDRTALTSVLPSITEELTRPDASGWVIAGTAKSLSDPKIRSLLSLAALAAQAAHGLGFPILISPSGGKPAMPLPTPLADARIAPSAIGPLMVADLHKKQSVPALDYRLGVIALSGLGLWLEVGPCDGSWKGAIVGLSGIDGKAMDAGAFGVGTAGVIPQRCTLELPVRGMQATIGDLEFSATGAANALSPAESAFCQVSALPGAIFLGPFPEGDDPDLWTVRLA